MSGFKNIAGQRFGRLVPIDYLGDGIWLCKCDCGNEKKAPSYALTHGKIKSCGCFRREFSRQKATTHGGAGTRLYGVWNNMISRCTNPKNVSYRYYGSKGITVCDEWLSFENFRKWAFSSGYDDSAKRGECTLDRIDPDGNYEPSNCRWVNSTEQANNTGRNVNVEYKGKSYTIAELARYAGIKTSTFWARLNSGWSIEDAIEIPIGSPSPYRFKDGKPYTPVNMVDADGNVLKSYDGISLAAEDTGCSQSSITATCRGWQKSANGICFEYADKQKRDKSNKFKPKKAPKKPKSDGTKKIKVNMLDLDGNYIMTFDSLIEAARYVGLKKSGNIVRCCKGYLKKSHGYRWEYAQYV